MFARSVFSLRFGTMQVDALVDAAVAAGVDRLALTDINNTAAIPDFMMACEASGISPVAGAEIRNGNDHLFTLVARNNAGFREINEFITRHNVSGELYPDRAQDFLQCYAVYPLRRMPAGKIGRAHV